MDSGALASVHSRGLCLAFLDGAWTADGLVERGRLALALRDWPDWLAALVRRVLSRFPGHAPTEASLVEFIDDDDPLANALALGGPPSNSPLIKRWFLPQRAMVPIDGAPSRFAIRPLHTVGALQAFLGLDGGTLDWFADTANLNRKSEPRLRHYSCRFVPKRSGGSRLLETPKSRIKALQRRVLDEVLAPIPAHDAVHGFTRGRSATTFAEPHCGARVVVRFDLEDFFVSVGAARIRTLLLRVGYPRSVAARLAGLCCAATPEDVVRQYPANGLPARVRFCAMQRLRGGHLPQGAPTSPALSNLAAFPLDRRLSRLAESVGARYTRYADDLAFSGAHGFERSLPRFAPQVGGIVLQEGFQLNYHKTRVMRSGHRQQLCGLVVNQRPSVRRCDYDRLRALLHNALRTGPGPQNRDGHADFRAHLQGRIAWVAATNATRGNKLRALYDQITW